MSSPPHVCFYSNHDQLCKAFILELGQTKYKTQFRYICADPAPNRPKLPDWLKKVPTIVIAGENEPREGQECINWLFEIKMKENAAKQQQATKVPDGAPGGEPLGFSSYEFTSFNRSFGYSFMNSDTSTSGEGGANIPGTFAFLNGGAAPGDRVGQDFPGSTNQTARQKSKKEELFDKQMEAYQRAREEGMPKAMPRQ